MASIDVRTDRDLQMERWKERGGAMGTRQSLGKALGWFSIALGAVELLAPARLSRALGAPRRPGLVRALGARELTSGVGILRGRRPASWLWSRVAGDALDLALLGMAMRSVRSRRGLAIAAAAVAGVALLDLVSSRRESRATYA
jgi:hypothetical protein